MKDRDVNARQIGFLLQSNDINAAARNYAHYGLLVTSI